MSYVRSYTKCTHNVNCLGKFHDAFDVGWWVTLIGEAVTTVVIATKAQVDPAHKGQSLIDDYHFLMMAPQEDACLDVVWVAKYLPENLYDSIIHRKRKNT